VQVVALWRFHEFDRQLGDVPQPSGIAAAFERGIGKKDTTALRRPTRRLTENSRRDCAANRRPIITLKLHEHCGKLFHWMNFR
jgi:hypothetical protein